MFPLVSGQEIPVRLNFAKGNIRKFPIPKLALCGQGAATPERTVFPVRPTLKGFSTIRACKFHYRTSVTPKSQILRKRARTYRMVNKAKSVEEK
jgi:hypothetical protein